MQLGKELILLRMLSAEEIEFIEANRGLTGAEAMLRAGSGAHGFDLREAATQIDCRRKCAGKLPGFLKHSRFRFPDPLSAEQCTREDVARFHASLIEPGERVLDMTAGLGIDAMSLALGGARVTAVEIDAARAQALRENAALLGAQLQVLFADSRKVLEELPEPVDTIFIDPARRDSAGRRTYGFADCTPDLLSLLPLIMSRCSRLLVKASPLLDVTQILRELPGVSRLRAVEAGGECKELLIEVKKVSKRL